MRTPIVLISLGAAAAAAAGAMFLTKPGPAFPESSPGQERKIARQSPLKVGVATADSAAEAKAKGREVVSFGTGCFWCSEDDFRRTLGVTGTEVGYQGGHKENPTYKEVCEKKTGHVEVTRVEFDPKVVSFKTLAQRFFEVHDPTQGNRQGPDIGEQYRSVIYTYTPEQAKIAKEVMAEAQKTIPNKITTTIEPAPKFWKAEDYHQQYYQKMGYSRDK